MKGGPLPDFSTRPRTEGLRTAEAVLLGAALLAAAGSGWLAWDSTRGLRDAERVTQALGEADAERLRSPESAADRALDEHLASLLLTHESPPPAVLAELTTLLPGDVRLARVEMRYGRTLVLLIDVVARDPAAYDRFLERLCGSPRFSGVSPGAEIREGEVRSAVRATYRART